METLPSRFSFSKMIKIIAGLAAGYTFWFFLLLLTLRWVNPSFTSFTLQEDWDALGTERYALTDHWVDYEELPENLQWAVVASEDKRFWEHPGVDVYAIGKALQEREEEGRVRGASTISQQVTKNLFLWGGQSYFRKGIEAVITLGIEVVWPKERLLEVYLNIAEFGPGIYGVGKATDHFFGKTPGHLEADEAARLAAVLPNPKRMRVEPPSPYVAKRKDWILRNMTQLSGIAYIPVTKPKEEKSVIRRDSTTMARAELKDLNPVIWVPVRDTSTYLKRIRN